MVTRVIRPIGRARLTLALAAGLGLLSAASACDKMPLLAPGGTVITIFPASTTVSLNGEIEIVATVIENGTTSTPPATPTPPTNGGGTTNPPATPNTTATSGAGTPVQNGTLVSFTTTIGRVEPREARTQNGEVRVRFVAGGQSGTAIITAYSGGASGRLENLRVGTAAAERVVVTATPQTLGPAGGTTNFTADTGQLNPSTATTDASGVARTSLTTTRETKVTANVAGKTAEVTVRVNPRTGVRIVPPTEQIAVGTPARFTISVGGEGNPNTNVRDVTVDFGDGRRQSLGPITGDTTVSHTYTREGTFVVSATAVEASGFTETVSTSVNVLPGQPPSVIVTPNNSSPTVNETVILTAQVEGNTSTIVRYEWNFGSGAVPASATTSGNRATVTWTTPGTKVITVRAIQATGPSGEGFGTVVVRP